MLGLEMLGLWGKASGGSVHPLICHMIDAAQVAGVLWERVLSRRVRCFLEQGGIDEPRLQLLVGLHDLGKASPGFQAKQPSAYGGWPEALAGSSLPALLQAGERTGHAAASYHAVKEIVGSSEIAFVVGGHHGTYPPVQTRLRPDRLALGGRQWDGARRVLARVLGHLLGCGSLQEVKLDPALLVPLTGFVILADWIASNTSWFPYVGGADLQHLHLDSYLARARQMAERALDELSWRRWFPGAGGFSQRFPGMEPRPAQAALDEITHGLPGPTLVIVESETGSGKTEAAWHLAAQWVGSGHASGFYLALPTRATANAMYARCESFLGRVSGSGPILQQLVHGWASINSEFRYRLRRTMTGIDDEQAGEEAAVVAHSWFTYRRRGLLAPIGIGTVDQVLLAALRTRFTPIRLWGLWDKVLIVDEVHAYDTYMSRVLDRLLEWMAHLGVPVVLLSATLSRDRKRQLLEAYGGRGCAAGTDLSPYPSLSWVEGDGTVRCRPLKPFQRARRLRVRLEDGGDPERVAWAVEATRRLSDQGANVLVVLNTVERAQATADALRDLGDRLILVHARMPFEQRDEREREILRRFGPDAPAAGGSVLVGTQVLEQSLDIDLDVLVTDLAPIDLLLQRAGRIHRHPRRSRGEVARDPEVIVGGFRLGSEPVVAEGSAAVYSRWVLLRTLEALLAAGGAIGVPEDVRDLVEAVYGDAGGGSGRWPAALARAENEHRDEIARLEALAETRYVPPPATPDLFDRVTDWSVEDADETEADPARDQTLTAVTRVGEPSVTVVLSEPGRPLADPVDEGAVERLLRRSLSLTSPQPLVRCLRRREDLRRWPRHPLLRYAVALELDASGEARVEGFHLRLDPLLGLRVERNG